MNKKNCQTKKNRLISQSQVVTCQKYANKKSNANELIDESLVEVLLKKMEYLEHSKDILKILNQMLK